MLKAGAGKRHLEALPAAAHRSLPISA